MNADLITKAEAAEMLGGRGSPVSLSYINQLLGRKKLPRVRLSYRVTRIPRQAVEDYIRSCTTTASRAAA